MDLQSTSREEAVAFAAQALRRALGATGVEWSQSYVAQARAWLDLVERL